MPEDFAPDPRPDRPVRELVMEQCWWLQRKAIKPWYINIVAPLWDRARREWDLTKDGPPPMGTAPETYLGLLVFVWAPGSHACGSGLIVHGYPAGRPL